jgi:hypothetical protein
MCAFRLSKPVTEGSMKLRFRVFVRILWVSDNYCWKRVVAMIHTCFMSCSIEDPPTEREGLEEEAAVVRAWLRT